jgi:dephospho-CoA kinase
MALIGIYGGVGAGKSTITRIFREFGATVIVADDLVHASYSKPEVRPLIERRFGLEIYENGKLNQKALANIVFNDSKALKDLESIVHPYVEEQILWHIRHCESDLIVLDIPLLATTCFQELVTDGVFIDTPLDVRQEVCAKSRGWDKAEHRRREAKQVPIRKKRRLCRYIIKNYGEHREKIRDQVTTILDQILQPVANEVKSTI